jgi:hypothetical protein
MAGQHPLDGTDLGDLLTDLTTGSNIRPGIHLIAAGIRALAEDAHTGQLDTRATQLLLIQLCGSPDGLDTVGAIGELAAYITTDHNPTIRNLPDEQRKNTTHQGWLTSFHLNDPELRTPAAEACAALDQREEVDTVRNCLTDKEREELSKKVDKANKQSQNRPK